MTKNQKGHKLHQFERQRSKKVVPYFGCTNNGKFQVVSWNEYNQELSQNSGRYEYHRKYIRTRCIKSEGQVYMQGKPKPKPMRKDLIKIPKELMMIHHNNIELCMDTVYLNECSMLTMSLGPSSTKVWFHLKVDITKNTFVCSTKSSSTTRTLDLW